MRNRIHFLLAVALLVLAADQGTKHLAAARLAGAEEGRAARPHVLLEDYAQLRYVENPGAAHELLARLPEPVRAPFFHAVSLSALGFILWMYLRLGVRERLPRLALSLVSGGALGNYIDRVVRGHVVDFVDLHWRNQPGMRWPTFNVADCALCVGVALMLADGLRMHRAAAGLLQDDPESVAAGGRVV
jgi:signal peptidase II